MTGRNGKRPPGLLRFTMALLLIAAAASSARAADDGAAATDAPSLPRYPAVLPGATLSFPADHGAHPDFRTEWWYVTGWLDIADGRALGFQVTFFRSRPPVDQDNPSAFAPKQIVFAHAALSDPSIGRLLHDQRVARAGFGLAEISADDTDIVLDDWHLQRDAANRFHAQAGGAEFALDLTFTPTQPVLLQGEGGYRRKGPMPEQASYYYSLPHLEVSGTVRHEGQTVQVTGSAWMDHEWSSILLDSPAVGWDWVGLNLDGGGALTAFRVRDADGQALWAGGSLRYGNGEHLHFTQDDVRFTVQRRWRSPRTGADYPVEVLITVRLPDGERQWHVTPLFDDQELDSRSAGGPVYWEGAVRTEGGRGYLELTGYERPLRM